MLGNRKIIEKAARQYFETCRKNYRAQTTDVGKKKQEMAADRNKRRNRKKNVSHKSIKGRNIVACLPMNQKAKVMRQMIPAAEAQLGQEKLVGCHNVIYTDWMSSDRSGPEGGQLNADEWAKHRTVHMGSATIGRETRALIWRSRRVC